jgi:hypothetical protein
MILILQHGASPTAGCRLRVAGSGWPARVAGWEGIREGAWGDRPGRAARCHARLIAADLLR